MNQTLAWLGLSKIEDLCHKQIETLLQIYGKPEKIIKATKSDLKKYGLTEKQSQQIVEITEEQLEQEVIRLKQEKVYFITADDEKYPQQLREIYDFPYWIYARGNVQILKEKSIAIIGSRNCSRYGETVAKKLAYDIGKQNIHVVSGMAKGIDAFAHIGCMKSKGKTIAVLGCGVNNIYPKENEGVYRTILQQGGVVVSEYPLNTEPLAQHFPARNRIISGLCEKMIVVEAGERSGSFITVDFALEQGKEVYSVPGNITSSYSKRNK